MNKLFQIILVYALGILCVFSLVWRVGNLDSKDNNKSSLVKNEIVSNENINN
jgi:hypothetical protein